MTTRRDTDSSDSGEEGYRRAVGRESPEGMPASADPHSGWLRVMLVMLFVALVVVGIVVAWIVNLITGVVIVVVGTLFLIANPVVWAGFSRATERHKVEDERSADATENRP